MKPQDLKTKIFLDGGDPNETKEIIDLLGFLDGQTTNPTLISKNPEVKARLRQGETFSKGEIFAFYKKVVKEISLLLPRGSISVEVYADRNTKTEDMLWQAREMFSWIGNAHIKFPINAEGLKTAKQVLKEGMRVNMTLCFSQEQAAAVYAATKGARRSDVFVSPFVGRLDDRGENGMELIANIIKMYQGGDGHVEVLTASVRNNSHFLYALVLGSDIITAPFAVLKEWSEKGMPLPDEHFRYDAKALESISYQEIDLEKEWREYNISHELTDAGIERFSNDWNALIRNQ
ncbi:MAG: transaldolase [Candidatus Portnoybacteria bacterium]|nr:transaldolase [Candidatus Portnoybacteria bacterium]